MAKTKYIIMAMVLALAFFSCKQEPVHIHADISNLPDGEVYLRAYEGTWQPIDSTASVAGKFEFTLPKIMPNVLYVIFKDYPGYFIPIIVDGNEASINGDINQPDEIVVSGSEANDALFTYRTSVRRYEIMLRAINMELKELSPKDSLYLSLRHKQDSVFGIISNTGMEFIRENPSNMASAFLASSIVNDSTSKDRILYLLNTLDPDLPDNAFVRKLNRKLAAARK